MKTPSRTLLSAALGLALVAPTVVHGQAQLAKDLNTSDLEIDSLSTGTGVNLGAQLLFAVETDDDGAQLWSSNGTTAGTALELESPRSCEIPACCAASTKTSELRLPSR